MNQVLLWPGGNTTALVLDFVPDVNRSDAAVDIMRENLEVEQVGFMMEPLWEGSDCRMRMMGGEFCINATRSAAFFFAKQRGLSHVKIETSGLETPLDVEIDGDYTEIFLPKSLLKNIRSYEDFTIVDLDGIRHIVTALPLNLERDKKWIGLYSEGLPAVGVIHVESFAHCIIKIDPYIWVRETDSFIHETGCGSGSLAAAIVARNALESRIFTIIQPSEEGYVIQFFDDDSRQIAFSLKGIVKCLSC